MRSLWLCLALQNAPGPAPAPAPIQAPAPVPVPATAPALAPAPAPAKDDKSANPAAKPKELALDQAIDTLEANRVVAVVNGDVVTVRDVLLAWKLEGRGSTDPDRKAFPGDEELKAIKKEIVELRLWRGHARLFPAFVDFMTATKIDEYARESFAPLLHDSTLTEEEKGLIRERSEEALCRLIVLENDPEFRRVSLARPDDVQRWWDDPLHKESRHIPMRATLGRVMLGRDLYGDKVEALAKDLRQRAQEKGSLEVAAQELAPGSYAEPANLKGVALEGPSVSLRDEVLNFAKSAAPGDLSAPIALQVSVMLFSLIAREEGYDITFEKAAPLIKGNLERVHKAFRAEEYFVTKVLTEAFFLPPDLFDEEIDRFFPGTSAQRKSEANRKKPAAAGAGK